MPNPKIIPALGTKPELKVIKADTSYSNWTLSKDKLTATRIGTVSGTGNKPVKTVPNMPDAKWTQFMIDNPDWKPKQTGSTFTETKTRNTWETPGWNTRYPNTWKSIVGNYAKRTDLPNVEVNYFGGNKATRSGKPRTLTFTGPKSGTYGEGGVFTTSPAGTSTTFASFEEYATAMTPRWNKIYGSAKSNPSAWSGGNTYYSFKGKQIKNPTSAMKLYASKGLKGYTSNKSVSYPTAWRAMWRKRLNDPGFLGGSSNTLYSLPSSSGYSDFSKPKVTGS